MNNLLLFVITLSAVFGSVANAYEPPEVLENACYEGSCTEKMHEIYDHFLNHKNAPKFIPGMYSGDCYHKSTQLDPNTKHFLGLLIDQYPKGFYMAPVLQFFGDRNDMADWSLSDARNEMNPDWKKYGPMKFHPTSATQFVLDEQGYPAMVYWARQDIESKTIFFMAFLRGLSTAFCEVRPNKNGLIL